MKLTLIIAVALASLIVAIIITLASTAAHAADHPHQRILETVRKNKNNNANPLAPFCHKYRQLCDELNHLGIHRHDQVADLGVAAYRSLIEASVESLRSAAIEHGGAVAQRIFDSTNIMRRKKNSHQQQQSPSSSSSSTNIMRRKKNSHQQQQSPSSSSSSSAHLEWVDSVTSSDVAELRTLFRSMLKKNTLSNNNNKAAAARALDAEAAESEKYPYFGFVPHYLQRIPVANANPNASTQPIPLGPTPCSIQTTASAYYDTSRQVVEVNVTNQLREDVVCLGDYWLFAIGPAHVDATVDKSGNRVFNIDVRKSLATPSLVWDLKTNGVRVFRNIKGSLLRTLDVIDTLLLFKPMITNTLDPESAQHNTDFVNEYTKITPPIAERSFKGIVNIPRIDMPTGTILFKAELDGLGPAEGLGQGTIAGHVATVLHADNGEILVCEAVIKGITCTPYQPWIENLQKIGNAVVMAPLKQELSKAYNNTAAWAWVNKTLGNAYGYPNFIMGWIDLASSPTSGSKPGPGNLPCFPPDFTRCLTFESMELFIWHVYDLVPAAAQYFIGQALNHRAGTTNLDFPDVLEAGYKATGGKRFGELLAIPEQDSWLYNTTKQGHTGHLMLPAQVCSTLASNILRAAGVFDSIGGDFQATEMDVWDVASLNIFDSSKMGSGRPKACVAADPNNALCQLCGNFTFVLQQHSLNTRAPWRGMNNDCRTQNPAPYNHGGCFSP